MQSDVAVLAKTKEFLIFKVANADVFVIDDSVDAELELKKLAMRYKLIIVSETLAEQLSEQLKFYEAKSFPTILCLPEAKKSSNFALKNLVKKTKNALGLDIFKENL